MQRKVDETPFFDRPWAQFRAEFGSRDGNYWLGNERLHQLTKDGGYKLRIDLQQRFTGDWFWVEYDTFVVGSEATTYTLRVGNFSGNTGDMLRYANGLMFSTYDRDHDRVVNYPFNCAAHIQGGFWYFWCGYGLLNGAGNRFNWFGLAGEHRLLRSEMRLLCR